MLLPPVTFRDFHDIEEKHTELSCSYSSYFFIWQVDKLIMDVPCSTLCFEPQKERFCQEAKHSSLVSISTFILDTSLIHLSIHLYTAEREYQLTI